jgi:hypothetical protein
VEGTLVSVLVGFGIPHAHAVLGVITWRLAEFWLPIPLSALTYLSLRTGTLRHTGFRPARRSRDRDPGEWAGVRAAAAGQVDPRAGCGRAARRADRRSP